MRRRLILIATAASIATLAVLAPAGAGARATSKRALAPMNIMINGSRSNAPVFVHCAGISHRGTATSRNRVDAVGTKGHQYLVQLVPDGTRRFVVTAGTPAAIPGNVRVPCGGNGYVRVREQTLRTVTKVCRDQVRAGQTVQICRTVTKAPAHLGAGERVVKSTVTRTGSARSMTVSFVATSS